MKTAVLLLSALGLAVAAPNNNNQHQDLGVSMAGGRVTESGQFGFPINLHLQQQFNVSLYSPHHPGPQNVLCGDEKADPTFKQRKQKKFYLQNQEVNWFIAFQLCRLNGKRLATISDEEENSRLKALLDKYSNPPQSVWLSGTDLGHEGRYTWMSTGQPFTFTDWIKDEPNNGGQAENCVQMTKEHTPRVEEYAWNDLNCHEKNSFVCESF